MQVNGGHCSSDEEAKNACKQLAVKLGQDQAPAKSSFRVLAGQQLRQQASSMVVSAKQAQLTMTTPKPPAIAQSAIACLPAI